MTRRHVTSPPSRVARAVLADHLSLASPSTRGTVLALRKTILAAAPTASEAIRFHSLCYFHAGAAFKSIGGNICLIQIRHGSVVLAFIHGADLPDPACLLSGSGLAKRFVAVPDSRFAASRPVVALIRAAARQAKQRKRSSSAQ